MLLLYPTYFPSISQFAALAQADAVTLEVCDSFQKQTNRNRMYIYSPNGRQLLNVPVKHDLGRRMTRDVRVDNSFGWQKQHFKSLEAAYRSSPFFEYFEDDIAPVFTKRHEFLMDLDLETMEIVSRCMGLDFKFRKTVEYFHQVADSKDIRHMASGKKDTSQLEPYTQVFGDRHGFLNNLSVLDLLFNEGRHARDYLLRQVI